MAVLVEGTSVITRADSLLNKFSGGWEQFERTAPNNTLCADGEIAAVAFMTPIDVEQFIHRLQDLGLEYMRNGEAIDFTVADAIHGILSTCPWLEFGRVPVSGTDHGVAACRLAGGKSKEFVTPPDWIFAKSLSATSTFVPNERVKDEMRYLRREGAVDVYLCVATGKEMFVGRTSKSL
jgi:hypothetical protein